VAVQLYRIGQEAVANALKHARASRIHIALEAQPGKLELRVEDNGRGFSPNASRRQTGLGLRAMKYRANLIGSVLQIVTSPGGGTRISCTLAKRN
jgi:signal transduction histidine kinase